MFLVGVEGLLAADLHGLVGVELKQGVISRGIKIDNFLMRFSLCVDRGQGSSEYRGLESLLEPADRQRVGGLLLGGSQIELNGFARRLF